MVALLHSLGSSTIDQDAKVELVICLRHLSRTFALEFTNYQDEVFPALFDLLLSASVTLKLHIMENISSFGYNKESAFMNLIFLLNDPEPAVVKTAVHTLCELGVCSRDQLRTKMMELHILHGNRIDEDRPKFTHPIDVQF
jgi:hypothetical protein